MDKFLCIFELAHGSIVIGAAKFVFSLVKSYLTFQSILMLSNRHGARFTNFEDTIVIEEATTGSKRVSPSQRTQLNDSILVFKNTCC